MGRKQGDTDLRTLQKHLAEENTHWERAQWLKQLLAGHKVSTLHGRVTMRRMSLLGFQVMSNECQRRNGIRIPVRYRGL